MLFGQDRNAMRRFYVDAWRKYRDRLPTGPLETLVAQVVAEHPEYHRVLEHNDAVLDQEYLPDAGESNPFLHMGLHLALREQIATQRPAGITQLHQDLLRRHGDAHAAEHAMMECLVESIWQAQRNGTTPDESAYLECVRGLL